MLRVLGLLFIALLVLAGMAFGYWIHQGAQAREFVAASIPVIFKNWSAEALTRRSAEGLQTPEYESKVREMFQTFIPHLGEFVSAETPDGSMHYNQGAPGMPRGIFGDYSADAKFAAGEARIQFIVIKEEGAWRIARFEISSPALLAAMQKQRVTKNERPNYERGPPDEEAAIIAEADEVFRLMDSEDPGSAWHRGSLPFQEAKPKRRFVADMKRLHDISGTAQVRKLQGVGFMFDRQNAKPPGDYAVADYVSTYSRVTVRERLGFYRHEGPWQFSGHQWDRIDEKAQATP